MPHQRLTMQSPPFMSGFRWASINSGVMSVLPQPTTNPPEAVIKALIMLFLLAIISSSGMELNTSIPVVPDTET